MIMWPMSMLQQRVCGDNRHFAAEFMHLPETQRMTKDCVAACNHVMARTPGIEAPNLVIIESEGAPCRRAFIGMPTYVEWLYLEQASALMTDSGQTFILVDCVH